MLINYVFVKSEEVDLFEDFVLLEIREIHVVKAALKMLSHIFLHKIQRFLLDLIGLEDEFLDLLVLLNDNQGVGQGEDCVNLTIVDKVESLSSCEMSC